MGLWLHLALASTFIAGIAAAVQRAAVPWRAVYSYIVVAIVAYVAVSVPTNKSPFLGVLVPCMILVGFVHATSFLYALTGRSNRRIAWRTALTVTLLGSAFLLAEPHWSIRSGGVRSADRPEVAARRFALVRDLADRLESRVPRPREIFFATATDYCNATTLAFELERRRQRPTRLLDALYETDGSSFRERVQAADVVISFEESYDELMSRLPSTKHLGLVNGLISDTASWEVEHIDAPNGEEGAILFASRRQRS
jgi:hypothetical protein